jgi:hypothetical protein
MSGRIRLTGQAVTHPGWYMRTIGQQEERAVAKQERVTAWNGNAYREPGPVPDWRYFWGAPIEGAVDVLDAAGRVLDCLAPELAPSLLLGSPEVCHLLGWRRGTLWAKQSTGELVPPVGKVGNCHVWTLPQIRWYQGHRPFRAGDWPAWAARGR